MQISSIFSVSHGTSLCLGIVLVKISGTYQLNEGQIIEEQKTLKELKVKPIVRVRYFK